MRGKLFADLAAAVQRADSANEAFAAITGGIPLGVPHPDGVQRIHGASLEMTEARDEMMKAHNRLNDFLNSGIVPDDLKQNK